MPTTPDLAETVVAMRPMVPAKDFEISKRFYIELGFQPRILLPDRLVEMSLGPFSLFSRPTTCGSGPTISWFT
jgi:hypothetical protein